MNSILALRQLTGNPMSGGFTVPVAAKPPLPPKVPLSAYKRDIPEDDDDEYTEDDLDAEVVDTTKLRIAIGDDPLPENKIVLPFKGSLGGRRIRRNKKVKKVKTQKKRHKKVRKSLTQKRKKRHNNKTKRKVSRKSRKQKRKTSRK